MAAAHLHACGRPTDNQGDSFAQDDEDEQVDESCWTVARRQRTRLVKWIEAHMPFNADVARTLVSVVALRIDSDRV